ncbi:hypothetical protein BDR26DRAFT_895839 [Obelidium mucronatum]|nr:hypothetical protein BDR26DRAFT_895839 [Obelidium mucronatum]
MTILILTEATKSTKWIEWEKQTRRTAKNDKYIFTQFFYMEAAIISAPIDYLDYCLYEPKVTDSAFKKSVPGPAGAPATQEIDTERFGSARSQWTKVDGIYDTIMHNSLDESLRSVYECGGDCVRDRFLALKKHCNHQADDRIRILETQMETFAQKSRSDMEYASSANVILVELKSLGHPEAANAVEFKKRFARKFINGIASAETRHKFNEDSSIANNFEAIYSRILSRHNQDQEAATQQNSSGVQARANKAADAEVDIQVLIQEGIQKGIQKALAAIHQKGSNGSSGGQGLLRPSSSDIFIKNVPFKTLDGNWFTDDKLADIFKEYGVAQAKLARGPQGQSKGFGFVTLKDGDDKKNRVNQAIAKMNGSTVEGRNVIVVAAANKTANPSSYLLEIANCVTEIHHSSEREITTGNGSVELPPGGNLGAGEMASVSPIIGDKCLLAKSDSSLPNNEISINIDSGTTKSMTNNIEILSNEKKDALKEALEEPTT